MLMTATWQPTVLQLMPFASNNANCPDDDEYQQERVSFNRVLPRLAVTRVQTCNGQNKIARSVSEYTSRSKDYREKSKSLSASRISSENNTRSRMATSDVGYFVNDLNDQVIYSSKGPTCSNTSSENFTNKHWHSSSGVDLSEPVKFLPKPNIAKALDGRYFMPQNGVWRAVAMTPGEIDLQKQRGNVSKYQYRRPGKKHKVNINSIPRSTTPITDYDPDKLNMKHVIAFLQKNNVDVDARLPENQELVEQRSDKSRSSNYRNRLENSETSDAPTEMQTRHRVRSSDNMPTMEQRFKHSGKTAKHSKRRERSTHHPKQFRLHRFLTVTAKNLDPSESISKHSHAITNLEENTLNAPNPHLESVHNGNTYAKEKVSALPKKSLTKSSLCSKPSNPQERYELVNNFEGVIRLPNMFDVGSESDDEVNSEPHVTAERQKRCFNTDGNYKTSETVISSSSHASNNSNILTKAIPLRSKKLQISLPDQTIKPQPADNQVRLTMRKERRLTRETTYMSDLVDSRSNLDHRESMLSSVCSFRQECTELNCYE